MKLFLMLLLVLSSVSCYAGSAGCTNSVSLTHSGDYVASASDCVITVDKTVFEFTTVTLPNTVSDGDELTIKLPANAPQECSTYNAYWYNDATGYYSETETDGDPSTVYYPAGQSCWPAGVSIQTENYSRLVGGSQQYVIGGNPWFVMVKYDVVLDTWNVVGEGSY